MYMLLHVSVSGQQMTFSQYVTKVFGQAALTIRKNFNSTGVPYSKMITGKSSLAPSLCKSGINQASVHVQSQPIESERGQESFETLKK